MKPFINIGGFGDKRLEYKRGIVIKKNMPITDVYSYIVEKGLDYLPSHETMDFIDVSNRYSLFDLIASAVMMAGMIDIQKQEQVIYTASFSRNGDNGNIRNREITYSVKSGIKFEIDGGISSIKSKLINALTGRYYSNTIVRRKGTEKCANIDIMSIIDTIFGTDFIQKIRQSVKQKNSFSLSLEVVYQEIDDFLLSAEERNNIINEALLGMLETFEKITISPTS